MKKIGCKDCKYYPDCVSYKDRKYYACSEFKKRQIIGKKK